MIWRGPQQLEDLQTTVGIGVADGELPIPTRPTASIPARLEADPQLDVDRPVRVGIGQPLAPHPESLDEPPNDFAVRWSRMIGESVDEGDDVTHAVGIDIEELV